MEKLYRLYLDDGITVESFRRRNGPLEERLGAIETEVPTLRRGRRFGDRETFRR